ncbi:small-conductance mechanosensitive channel Msc1 [Corynebacterium suranareeae]|uniref:Small-conductance mechanosensitive channel Msc1 n=1 Tax=Corynebacterium suranareeae TaxID=2506452 RepID=A0A160PRE1_9CORY|nr:mechanosensitive ion channel family protein [Corynebacterium suranareeae]BAU95653.1 small-conductance mechanosensitive channel Msc1 [Corynebacterium suranareeae]
MILGVPIGYLLYTWWNWIVDTGFDLAIILVLAFLVPRIGRLAMRFIKHRVESAADVDTTKNQLAFAGVGVYIAQIVAFFLLAVSAMQAFGFSLAGAAIPATIASAAIGLGAQSIVADFLAGFFILTEKQFGVGDWVRFEGNGIVVEGTVIEITMRATKIRTIAQETVIIPNSTAKVCINNSNNWSRAVVVIPIPMLGSENITDVIARSEAATRRALAQKDIAPEILGELDVHPATAVTPPTVVGMPWMVTMRFLVQVTAGNQWLVERAIRTEIISEFWEEYGSATTTSGTVIDSLTVAHEENTSLVDASPHALKEPKPEAAATVASLAASSSSDDDANTVISAGNPEKALDSDVMEQELSEDETPDTNKDDHSLRGFFRTDYYPKRWQKILSLGGRTRMSTTLLLGALMLLSLFKVMTVEPSENWQNSSGWFSPSTTTTTETTTEETPAPVTENFTTEPTPIDTPPMETSVETQSETFIPETVTPQSAATTEPSEEETQQDNPIWPSTTASQTQTPESRATVEQTTEPTPTQ